MGIRGCWSCGSHAACYSECDCEKCINPQGYADWKYGEPEEYQDWVESQQLHGEECDCPGCM